MRFAEDLSAKCRGTVEVSSIGGILENGTGTVSGGCAWSDFLFTEMQDILFVSSKLPQIYLGT